MPPAGGAVPRIRVRLAGQLSSEPGGGKPVPAPPLIRVRAFSLFSDSACRGVSVGGLRGLSAAIFARYYVFLLQSIIRAIRMAITFGACLVNHIPATVSKRGGKREKREED